MIEVFLDALWFLAPAMGANLALYLCGTCFGKSLGQPIDANLRLGFHRLVGDSRTVVGLPICLLVGYWVGALQGRALEGLILGLGVDIGTVVHSFLKRRLAIAAGDSSSLFDHLDYCIGAQLAFALSFDFPMRCMLPQLLVGGLTHWTVSRILRPSWDPKEP